MWKKSVLTAKFLKNSKMLTSKGDTSKWDKSDFLSRRNSFATRGDDDGSKFPSFQSEMED